MPITPLHFGVLAPINHFAPGKVSNVSFILVNLWIDQAAIMYTLFGVGAITHGIEHSFLGTFLTALIVALFGFRSRKWILGAWLGGFTHTLLDSLVHPELPVFFAYSETNPLYMGWMTEVSLVLAILTAWFIAQIVSCTLVSVRRFLAAHDSRTADPSA